MAERPLYTLYKNLKAQNYDVPDDYDKFESALTRDGKAGADNRHAIYENLKNQNFDVPDSYERFYSALFEPRSKDSSRAKGGSVPMSEADKMRFTLGAGAVSASAQQTMNNAGRYNNLKQRKQKQQKDFGRVSIGTNKTPYGGDADNVVKDDALGTYVTSDSDETNNLGEAQQRQAVLDEQSNAYQEAVDTGDIPSVFGVRDKNGNYDLQENIGKDGTYLTDEGAQEQLDRKLDEAYARKKEIEAAIAEDNRKNGNPLLAYSAGIGAGNGRDAESSDYRNKLATSLSLVTQQIGALEAVKQYPTSSWGEDAWKALDNTAFTAKTWDFGLTDFATMSQMERIKTKMDNNIPLSGADKMLLKSKVGADAAAALEDEKMGSIYRWTKIAGQSLPFMADFFLTGGYGGVTKAMSRGALKFAAKRGMGKVSAAILKNTGIVAGDVIGSYAMAGTEQAMKTGADIMQRHMGNLYQDENGNYAFGTFDENGNLLHEGGDSFGSALYKGLTSAMVENYTEKLFGHNYGLKKGALKFMEKHGMGRSAEFFKNIGQKEWYAGSKKWMEKFGINGFAEEVMEEEIGIPLHALLDGDNKMSDLLDPKQQLDIIGGMAISVGSMYAMGAGTKPLRGVYNRAQYYRFKHKVDVADSEAQQLFGENWGNWKEQMDNATNEKMGGVLYSILQQRDNMSKEQMNAAIMYGVNLMKMRGYNIAKTAEMNAKEMTGEQNTEQENHDEEVENAYAEGHEADGEDTHTIQMEQNASATALANMLGITEEQLHDMSDEELEAMNGQNDKLDQAIYDYQNSTAKYQGVMDNANDKVDMAARQAAQLVDQTTDLSRGSVRNATIQATNGENDYGVYIISGNLATHEDGSINISGSDQMILYYDPKTGRKEYADPSRFAAVGEEVPAEDVKAQAVADAKEKAIREVAGIIDGKVEVGSQFSVTDADGTEHTYEVLADNGDGTAAITLDGNVEQNPYSFEDLQQLKDAEDEKKMVVARQQRAELEAQREQQAEEQKKQEEEKQAKLNQMLSEIIDDNNNVVMAAVEGQEDVDSFIVGEYNNKKTKVKKYKVVSLNADGTVSKPRFVDASKVKVLDTMSLNEYKQTLNNTESSAVEGNSGETEEPQPIGTGVFGNIYNQFKGKVKEAFNFLMNHKSGDLLGVFHRDDVGDIDLVWGDRKTNQGLDHIIDKHIEQHHDFSSVEDAMNKIDDIINNGTINEKKSKWDKVIIEKDGMTVVIRKNIRDNKGKVLDDNKNWIVTAFDGNYKQGEKKNASSDTTLATPSTNEGGRAVASDEAGIATNPTSTSHGVEGSESAAAPNDSTGKDTNNSSNDKENNTSLTLEDGTVVPMLEDGNPDFSQLTAQQTAELYDTQFGEDADQVISGWVETAKKALDKANNMTVRGKNFVEQKASAEAKKKAIADAQAAYDSATAIRDAYKERLISKEENTAEGRRNLIEKARRKFNRLKGKVKDNAEAVAQLYDETVGSLLHRLYDSTGIDVTDTNPLTAEEYVASNIAPYSLNYDGTLTSKGVKQETGLSREDFAKTRLLAKEGKGVTIDDMVDSLWNNRPSNLESLDTQDIRNALIGLIQSGRNAGEYRNYVQDLRIDQAENILEQQQRAEDNARFAEEQKAAESASNEGVNGAESTEVGAENAQTETKVVNEDNFNIDDIDFDNNYVVIHQTLDDNIESILENGLRTIGGLNGTSLFASPESIKDLLKTMREGHGHRGSTALVIMTFPKSMFGGKRVTLDDISTGLIESGVATDFTVPSDFISNIVTVDANNAAADSETAAPANEKNFPNKLREANEEGATEVPADATDEKPLGEQPSNVPFSAKDEGKLETAEERAANVEKNRVDGTDVVDAIIGKKMRKSLARIAKMMGAKIQYQYTDKLGNGWFDDKTNTIYLTLDSSITEGVQFIFGHEMTHEIKTKNPAAFEELKKLVTDSYGEDFDKAVDAMAKRYSEAGLSGYDRAYYEEEVIADGIGELIRDLNLAHSIAMKMSHPLLAKIHEILVRIKRALTGTEYPETINNIIRSIEHAYVTTANRDSVNAATQEGEGGQRMSLRTKEAPKKTQKVYKLMRLNPAEEGKLFPLFIGSGESVELGKWYDADSPKLQDLKSLSSKDFVGTRSVTKNGKKVKEEYNYGAYLVNNKTGEAMSLADFKAKYAKEFARMGNNPSIKAVNWATDNGYRWIKIEEKNQGQSRYGGENRSYYNYGINGSGAVSTFAMRPGWHAGSLPTMRQIGKGGGKNLRDDNFVWVEGEIPADIDYNEEAQNNADKDIPDHIPTDGFYLKSTNANSEAAQADKVGWYVAGAFKANRIMSDKETRDIIDQWNNAHPNDDKVEYDWKRESGKDFNAETMRLEDTPKFSIRVYHGSGADFTEFDFSHMGEGAGSQVFGWGGYVTSSEKIGKYYAGLGIDRNFDYPIIKVWANKIKGMLDDGISFDDAKQKAIDALSHIYNNKTKDNDELYGKFNKGYRALLESRERDFRNRNLYEVNIPDDNGSNYLDWGEKPSAEVATKILEGLYGLDAETLDDMASRDMVFRSLLYDSIKYGDKNQMIPILVKTNALTRGTIYDNGSLENNIRTVYSRLGNWFGSPKAASEFLSSAGFTGIKYPAGTIQGGAEEGDINYVIFKPEDMQIAEHTKFSLKTKPVRFEVGKSLSEDEKKEVLSTLKDAYKVNGVPFHIEETANGKEKRVYEPMADDYVVSDITNRPLRYYITLPDGRVAHPTEVYPNISDNEVKSSAIKQGTLNDEAELVTTTAIAGINNAKVDNKKALAILTELQKLPHETHDVGYGLNNAQSYDYKTGIFTSDAAQAIDYVVRRMRRKEEVSDDVVKAVKKAVADSYGMVDNLVDGMSETAKENGGKVDSEQPKTFEEFLNHPALKFSIKNEEQRKAAENAYNFAMENRPDKHKQYAIVDMEHEDRIPEYYEKKALANQWQKYYNKTVKDDWGKIVGKPFGNYKLFDLDKSFDEQVNKVEGDVPDKYEATDAKNPNVDNESGADYGRNYEQGEPSSVTYKDRFKAFKQAEANRKKTVELRKQQKETEKAYNSKSKERAEYNKQLMKEYMDKHGLSEEYEIPDDAWNDLRDKSFEKYQDELDGLFNKYKDLDRQIKAVADTGTKFSLRDNDYDFYANRFGVDSDYIVKFDEAMQTGNVQLGHWAMANIRRAYRINHSDMKLSMFAKMFDSVKNELYSRYGNLDELQKQYEDEVIAKRNVMEAARKKAEEEEAKKQKHLDELALIPSDEIDKRYMDAIEKNDEATAREMLDESARRKGYGDSSSEYQGQGAWAAPSNPRYDSDEERRADMDNSPDVNLEDMSLGYSLQPDDYFYNPRAYGNNTAHGLESIKAVKTALDALKRGEKDVKVRVYRAVPTSVKEGKLRNGDWVTPSKKYAEMHGNNRLEGKFRIIEDEVPANQLWWDGNDANEFGFDDGKEYKYKNAKNNRKLNDLITRDDNGNVIPPSKRFNSRKADVRYSIRTFHGTGANFDAFDSSHALEGEGSETFGHGVYVTNSGEIGADYAKRAKRKIMGDVAYKMPIPDAFKDNYAATNWYRNLVRVAAEDGFEFAKKDAIENFEWEIESAEKDLKKYKDKESQLRAKMKLAEATDLKKLFENLKEEDLPDLEQYKTNRYDVEIPDDNGQNYLKWHGALPSSLDKNKIIEEAYKVVSDNHGFGESKATKLPSFVAHILKTYVNTFDVDNSLAKLKKDIAEVIAGNEADDDVMKLDEYLKDAKPNDVLATIWYNDLIGDIEDAKNGEQLYRKLETYTSDKDASRILSNNGIVGMKYRAGMINGGAKENDYNYVIYKDSDAKIVGNTKFSLRADQYQRDLEQWKKDNNLPKDAQMPAVPVRAAGETAADFVKRVKEYRQQMALWKTAPRYEGHLLTSGKAQGEFNQEMQRGSVLARIALQDSMLAIRKAQEAILKEVGLDRLNIAEDAYTAENRSHGKGKNEFEEYNDEFLQPLRKAYNKMMKNLGKSYDNVKVYMMAKHGLERNAHMAFKKALEADYEKQEERVVAYNAYKNDIKRVQNDADFITGKIDFTTWRRNDNAIRMVYAPSYMEYRYDKMGITQDYSGLSALFDGSDFEEAAAELVKDVESKHQMDADYLWLVTNAATKKILRDSWKAGMMSDEVFDFVRGMYNHYIPLRGWGDTNADQVWNYVGGGKGAFNQALKEANGRGSLADDPIAYIENMAESGILINNKNWVKQHLLLLAENHPTSLLNVSKAWYVKTKDAAGNEEWIPASPNITANMNSLQVEAALDAFEKKMEAMEKKGDATQKREHLEISYPQTKGEEREHEVRVMKNGEEYVIYINGDPQLAQAMNNTRAHRVREGLENSISQKAIAWLGRKMAAAYTSLSPLFIPSNFFRDTTMTLASTAIREDARYNYLLRKNMLTHWNTLPLVMRYQNGTLRDKVRTGKASETEKMFYDFMMNGGETGFVSSLDVENLKKKFKNDLKDMNRMAANPKKVGHLIMDSIETLNRAIEDSNRFAIYMTSIQYGRSIDEAVNDAKDVTLNFNRKGTGEHGWQTVRNLYLFINPAVQSLQTLGALAKHHPFKFTAVTTAWLASGLLVPMINNALMSMFGGDDDKDKYWSFTKWDRRNNLIIWVPFTHDFVKIPLAQEFRGFYGVGDMIASKLWGGEKAEETWEDYGWDLMGQVVDMLPLDPTGYDGNVAVSLMPNPIRPMFELAFNVDFTGKPLFKESEYNKYDPNFTKAYAGTPDWLVRISKMVNSVGNDYPDVQQNAIDKFGDPRFNLNNPAVVDHVLSSYLGGAYTMGSQILGVATKALNGDEIKMADVPLASKFVGNPDDRPVSKKQGDEFWTTKERHDRAANTLSKLKKKAKVDGDYSTLDVFFDSDEYKQYKLDDKVVKKYEEDKKKERAEESGEEYRPHKTTYADIYKNHATQKDDFEDLKLSQLYNKVKAYNMAWKAMLDMASSQASSYYEENADAINAAEDAKIIIDQINDIKKGFLSNDGKDEWNAEEMKEIRDLRKKVLPMLEKADKTIVAKQKAKAENQ